ncbi:hypothetical protein N7478_012427 [Penicillium angulare]|uniref:uncharacterized protein n=1 Tax=Penicillium angulare TaxID=116970 RepID=UPI0025417F88|nr:uncharacterized protein N7478_012427 [Penicillium angulare]KAJ5259446.1 hypothetical protein N7478_012427 [Penicillium angulare]
MPGLLRKLIIIAAVDGLILHGHGVNGPRHNNNGSNNEASSIRIDYKTNKISALPTTTTEVLDSRDDLNLEAYGIVGLLSVASRSFLVSITQRTQVAQIQGRPIYAITNVALIPLSCQSDANRAITQAQKDVSRNNPDPDATLDSDSDSEDEHEDKIPGASTSTENAETETEIPSAPTSPSRAAAVHTRGASVSSIAEDVIGKRVPFGRFAANWLSRKNLGLARPGPIAQDVVESMSPFDDSLGLTSASVSSDVGVDLSGLSTEGGAEGTAASGDEKEKEKKKEGVKDGSRSDQAAELLPKLINYTKLLFSSHNFFFAYDYDLTRAFDAQGVRTEHLPLHKAVDPVYFWNKHLMFNFIENGAHGFVLPLLQGFVGQREFTVASPEKKPNDASAEELTEPKILGNSHDAASVEAEVPKRNFLLTLISRRSVNRPGLRYLRRGVDDQGNTANTVETEQILSGPRWDPSDNVYSYLQVRGSIPLYFSQSPYAFKPVPVLHHSTEINQLAFERHFREMSRRYGKIQAVSLIDKHAGELKLGEQYEMYTDVFNKAGGIEGSPLGLEWFDFHNECRGMKFENVSRLVDRVKETLEEFGYTSLKGGTSSLKQTGIMRTNCMDCLDRTGVAQCAFGQWALERQLQNEGLAIDLGGDSSTQWFNTLWADNGDAISKQYSSTAALKGDYTRTRKRDYRGALNDFGLTLSRYYNNIVNDYFSQACIDYLLGNVSKHVFDEFSVELQTTDPGISVGKIRQNAIDTSCKIVISSPSEEFLGGWTMSTPRQPNTLRTLPFEESVLLLTDAAVYSCRFDWETDKVLSFERIDLRSISRIHYGTYVTSILTESQSDERTNVGLVIVYRDGDDNLLRVNTRSLQTNVRPAALEATASSTGEWDLISWLRGSKRATTRFVAFKSLPLANKVTSPRLGPTTGTVRELDRVRTISHDIERAMMAGISDGGTSQNAESESGSVVEECDIIPLADAKKRTGILEYLVYDIKKMVWA